MDRALFIFSTTRTVDTHVRTMSPVTMTARTARGWAGAPMRLETANLEALAVRCDAR